MCVWVWFVVTIHSFAGEAGAHVWALRLTTSETSSDEDVQQHQNQQFQFHMFSGDLPARTCLLWLLVVLVDLTDSSRTPVHAFINTPIFHFLPPDWSLPCVCSYLRHADSLRLSFTEEASVQSCFLFGEEVWQFYPLLLYAVFHLQLLVQCLERANLSN